VNQLVDCVIVVVKYKSLLFRLLLLRKTCSFDLSFSTHPCQYINWPIVGDLVPPDDIPLADRLNYAQNLSKWQIDNLPEKMFLLDSYLNVCVGFVVLVVFLSLLLSISNHLSFSD
jgi:hypothetical protein